MTFLKSAPDSAAPAGKAAPGSTVKGGRPASARCGPLIDVTRLVWRAWSGRLPTGVDKVCLAYLDNFANRAQAAVLRGRLRLVLAPRDSARLFRLLAEQGPNFRRKLLAMAPGAVARALFEPAIAGRVYLNVGHTGLDAGDLPGWVARSGVKAVFLVHDLIPITHPEFCRAGEEAKHVKRMLNVLDCANAVITNSRFTLDTLEAFARRNGAQVPPAQVAWITGHRAPRSVQAAKLSRPHFIVVGTIEGRKNHILLLRMWRRLAQRLGSATPKLVIIGQRGWEAEHAIAMLDRSPDIRDHVIEMGSTGDGEIVRLIAGARALLMPSFIEGFGIPVVEAMQLGTPVIASEQPVFREIAGDIPTYLASHDGVGWERTVLDFLEDGVERRRQIEALKMYRPPDWPTHFAKVERFLACL